MNIKKYTFYLVLTSIMLSIIIAAYTFAYKQEAATDNEFEKKTVYIYFPDKDRLYLKAETKELICEQEEIGLGKAIIEALIKGPSKEELLAVLPEKTKLRAFYIGEGTAYVDFDKNIYENFDINARQEILTIYSIVNSLVLNIEMIDTVKIIIDGTEKLTFAGHIDIKQPLKANLPLIR